MLNASVAEMFDEIAALMEVAGENPFKIRAYKRAAEAVATLDDSIEDIAEAGRLREVEGLGEATAAKVQEFIATGQVRFLERLREEYPPGLVDLLRVPGLGPKKVALLYRERQVSSLEGLKAALESNGLQGLAGFGPKAIENIRSGLTRLAQVSRRLPLGDALSVASALGGFCRGKRPGDRWEVAGSLRRSCDTVGDINFVALSDDPAASVEAFVSSPSVLAVEERGADRATIKARGGLVARVEVVRENFGSAWFTATGSSAHIEGAKARAQELGLGWEQVLATCGSEADVYSALKVPFIEPELREGHGEWEAATRNALPQLLEASDLRGDLHSHSTWSDGSASIEEMARAMQARGYAYFAVTDHSKALAMANGLDAARLRAQAEEIARAQEKFPGLKILRGIECDILRDGSMDLDDDILHELDFVIASVHSGFTMDEATQTARMIKAIAHPAVDMVAHPTGRVLGVRPGYDVNVAALIEAAREHNTALEINASERLDLSAEHARAAHEAGVMLCIDTDAHSVRMLPHMEWGIATARRAWCEPRHVLNTRSLDDLMAWLARRG
jgi:DNA polymerase (family 10)